MSSKFIPKTKEEMKMLENHIVAFQGIISILAHRRMGLIPNKIYAIGKREGGVVIGRTEICIKPGIVFDDTVPWDLTEKPEELAVAHTLKFIFDNIKFKNRETAVDCLQQIVEGFSDSELTKLQKFITMPMGDPLRDLFYKEGF